MGLHSRAWSGVNLLAFARQPMLAMRLEQAIAAASPANEVRIESFENYDQAYDFCKDRKSVGLIFISEDTGGDVLAADLCLQLGSPYEKRGIPAFGVLLHHGQKSFIGYRSLDRNKHLIAYLSVDDLLDPLRTADTLNDVWNQYIHQFEQHLVPDRLQQTLLSIAGKHLSQDSLRFRMRAATMLSHGLNVSWMESVALRWQPVVASLKTHAPEALEPSNGLVAIADLAKPSVQVGTLDDLFRSTESLSSRLSSAALLLDRHRLDGSLDEALATVVAQSRPGVSALVKRLGTCADRLRELAKPPQEQDTQLTLERAE